MTLPINGEQNVGTIINQWILVIPAFRFDEFNGNWYYRLFGSPSANCVIPLPPVAPLPPSISFPPTPSADRRCRVREFYLSGTPCATNAE